MKTTLSVHCIHCRGAVTLWLVQSPEELRRFGVTRQGWVCPLCKHGNESSFGGELVVVSPGHEPRPPRESTLRFLPEACVGPIARRERPLAREFEHLVRTTLALSSRTSHLLKKPLRQRQQKALRKQIRQLQADIARFKERRNVDATR